MHVIFPKTNSLHLQKPHHCIGRINSMESRPIIEIDAIRKAYAIIRKQAYETPVHKCPELSKEVQDAIFNDHDARVPMVELFFKCENLQKAGSFKFRGAYHFLSQLSEKALRAGIVSYSTGTAKPDYLFSMN